MKYRNEYLQISRLTQTVKVFKNETNKNSFIETESNKNNNN